ncbi:uncharacterized protein si:ch211-1a19.3 [Conger conger]|uniref:uncharacterized protein si:ch211-1a19.3 n=1 Tax=Conger conger TaxID=82655 RepID=UPI002A5AE65E|nr:uncharacterized protein si:ch211-1a19.3 [Conger conger]
MRFEPEMKRVELREKLEMEATACQRESEVRIYTSDHAMDEKKQSQETSGLLDPHSAPEEVLTNAEIGNPDEMASSKSSQTTRNIVIALLALWSVISLIIIVVWATSPDLKSASQCRAELQAVTEKMEGAKVMWTKDKAALEDRERQCREDQVLLRREISSLTATVMEANRSLIECGRENDLLSQNITVLEKEIEEHIQIEANLTSEITLQKDHIDNLELNLTQTSHYFESCEALRSAAESQQRAAESQTKACESAKNHGQKQLQQCKSEIKDPSEQVGNRTPGLYTSPLVLLLCAIALHLLSS